MCYSPIAPGLKAFHDPTPSPYKVDLKRPKRCSTRPGFPRGNNKIRFKVPLDYNPIGDESRRASEFFRAALASIGIAVDGAGRRPSAFVKRIYTDRDFDFTYNGHSNLFDPTVGVQRIYWSKNFKKGVPFSNGSHYENPKVDALLEGAAVENDPAKRKEMFFEFQKIVAEEIPDIPLYSPLYLTIKNKRVHDHRSPPTASKPTWRRSGSMRDLHPQDWGGVFFVPPYGEGPRDPEQGPRSLRFPPILTSEITADHLRSFPSTHASGHLPPTGRDPARSCPLPGSS